MDRKRKSRDNETSDHCESRCAYDKEYKRKKRAEETIEQRETRLRKNRERNRRKRKEIRQDKNQNQDIIDQLSESDRKLLQEFRKEMNKLTHNLCPICNERFPSIDIEILRNVSSMLF